MSDVRAGGHAPPSIESLGTPLAFKVAGPGGEMVDGGAPGELRVRSEIRALEYLGQCFHLFRCSVVAT